MGTQSVGVASGVDLWQWCAIGSISKRHDRPDFDTACTRTGAILKPESNSLLTGLGRRDKSWLSRRRNGQSSKYWPAADSNHVGAGLRLAYALRRAAE